MKQVSTLLFCIIISSFFGQEDGIWINPNRGQWHNSILYKVELNCGEMYLENNGFTYALNDFKEQMSHKHENTNETHVDVDPKIIHSHIIRSTFIGSSWAGEVSEDESSTHYRNYFQGNDRSKWMSNIKSYHSVQLKDFYPAIDLIVDGKTNNLKYSFIVKPKTDVSQIQYEINGATNLKIDEKGNLHILNRFGEIIEQKPIAWNNINGKKVFVEIQFKLKNSKISFHFPKGFDENEILVIDPSLTFSTFTGSTSDNWGMTATPDNQGNLFAGGIVFNDGGVYPTTTGAFDTSMNGGDSTGYNFGFDISISKFNSTGTNLLYSTYIGGELNEAPHSLFSGSNGDLYIMGVTASPNFPVTSGAFDESFNGGPSILTNELNYKGSDIFISKLSANGSSLLGSTYVGGSGTDGINDGDLNYNYGDPFRGEIIEGANGFIYVSSTTQSSDFPTIGASQNFLKGNQDAVVFKMNSTLSLMAWSTYFGGDGLETGNSIQQSSLGTIYIAGGTNSTNLSFLSGNDLSNNGGIADGYLARFNDLTGNIVNGTYMGFGEYDQAYFVQLDVNNDVYVFGQTESDWPITAGLYGVANSGQFIRKYSPDLSSIHWTTMVGAGTGNPEISPTAFLVSNCFDIYLSGWGGRVNTMFSNQAHSSTTLGFPVTSDAFQSTTNGDNFYIATLGHDATSLKYGSFMGGVNGSYNHVDGGTSRFDKSGRIYHAVCGACGGNPNGFTTTSGVYSPQNMSVNCNLAAFKFEMNVFAPVFGITDTLVCLPAAAIFRNNISNGNSFHWDFGDGTTSNILNPTHRYSTIGTYNVKLITKDTTSCFATDSIFYRIRVNKFHASVSTPNYTICPGNPYQLQAFGGTKYTWAPSNVLNSSNISSPIATVDSTTNFRVIISNECGIDTLYTPVNAFNVTTNITSDTTICEGQNVQLLATGGVSYVWSPATGLSNSNVSNPTSSPSQTTRYLVDIHTADGCLKTDTVIIYFHPKPPFPILSDSILCIQNPVIFLNNNTIGSRYSWNFGDNTFSLINNPSHYYMTPGIFKIRVGISDTIACFIADSVFLNIRINEYRGGLITPPDSICKNNPFQLEAFGGTKYIWSPAIALDNLNSNTPLAKIDTTTNFNVIVSDACGIDTFNFVLNVYNNTSSILKDTSICIGESISLLSNGGISYQWSPSTYLNNSSIQNPISTPTTTTLYSVIITTINNCVLYDTTKVNVFNYPPIPILEDSLFKCSNSIIEIQANGAESYSWSPNFQIDTLSGNIVKVNPTNNYTYYCIFKNACGLIEDSVFIKTFLTKITASDTTICPNGKAFLTATGGVEYEWYKNNNFIDSSQNKIAVYPKESTVYTVIGTDVNQCKDSTFMKINLFPEPYVQACPSINAILGDKVQLDITKSSSDGIYVWSPSDFLNCTECETPIAEPNKNFEYTVLFIDKNGCKTSDKVKITYDGLLFVPNSFTPDRDINTVFAAVGGNIFSFEMQIFDRWGNLIFNSKSIDEGWDGNYLKSKCQTGTYIWKIRYVDINFTRKELVGHVNLLR